MCRRAAAPKCGVVCARLRLHCIVVMSGEHADFWWITILCAVSIHVVGLDLNVFRCFTKSCCQPRWLEHCLVVGGVSTSTRWSSISSPLSDNRARSRSAWFVFWCSMPLCTRLRLLMRYVKAERCVICWSCGDSPRVR